MSRHVTVQRKRDAAETPEITRTEPSPSDLIAPRIQDTLAGGGQPLDTATRAQMEPRFGHDFSQVRVFPEEGETARLLQAQAYTVGTNIVFDHAAYDPASRVGQELIAHELAHTIQQREGPVTGHPFAPGVQVSAPADSFEQQAEQQAAAAVAPTEDADAASADEAGGLRPLPGASAGGAEVVVQRKATADAPPVLPPDSGETAPTSADADPAFQGVVSQVQSVGAEQRVHDPAEQKAAEAAEAAEMPPEERLGHAQDTQSALLESAATTQEAAAQGGQAPGFDKEAFKAAIRQKIIDQTPSDPERFENFKSDNSLDGVKADVSGQVDSGKQEAAGQIDDTAAAPPDTAAVPDKPTTALAPNAPGAQPAAPDAGPATPKPKGYGELEGPFQADSVSLDQQMSDAEVTEEQLQNSNEPTFTGALTAKTEAQTNAATAPPAYRATEQSELTTATAEANTQVQADTLAMFDQRSGLFSEVDGLQTTAKSDDEAARQKIGQDINRIYEDTKTAVEQRLAQLDGEVDGEFERGAGAAKAAFTDYVDRETTAYKNERYNKDGNIFEQAGGAVVSGWDGLVGMPQEYLDIYDAGRDLYIAEMDKTLDAIADLVGTALTEVRQRIADGREQIADYVAKQPDDLRAVAEQAASDVQGRFDSLEQQVSDKEQQLVDSLAQQYSQHLQALDAEIAAAKEANRGLIAQAGDLLGGVISTILELKAMLEGVLARAGGVITTILANPMQFVGNLISGVGQGLNQFVGKIDTHLQTGFVEWLTGTMGGAGIQLPATFDLPGIFDLAMQVLGLTYDNVRARAVGIFGANVVAALETGFEIFHILVTEGLPGLWEWVQDQLGNIKEMVFDAIQEMLIGEVIEAGIKWIVGLLGGPAGAFIKACMMIYDIVMWFVNNGSRLMALVDSVLDSVEAIAAGDLGSAATAVEEALGRAVPVTIGFLASLLGLGDLSQKVRKVIDRVQEPINTAIDYVLNLVRGFVQKVAKMLGFGGQEGTGGAGGELGKEVTFSASEESHRLWVDDQGSSATLMVASTPKPVDEQLAEWEGQLAKMSDEQRATAQSLLSQARSLSSGAEQDADFLAQKQQEVKKLEDGDAIAQRQSELEGGEDQLAGVLAQLFDIFEAKLSPEAIAALEKAADAADEGVSNAGEGERDLNQLIGEYEDLEREEQETQSGGSGTNQDGGGQPVVVQRSKKDNQPDTPNYGQMARDSGEEGEAARIEQLEQLEQQGGGLVLPTKPPRSNARDKSGTGGIDTAFLTTEDDQDVLELIEIKGGSTRVFQGRSRPLTGDTSDAITFSNISELNEKVLTDDDFANDVVLGGQRLQVRRRDKKVEVENKISAISSNLEANINLMVQALESAANSGERPEDALQKVQSILSGAGGILRIVLDIKEGVSFGEKPTELAKRVVNIAIDDYKSTMQLQKTEIEFVIRNWKK